MNRQPKEHTKVNVFICSRMEELAHSRRAAFEAILDCDCCPVLYENVRVQGGQVDPIARAREVVDQLLFRSNKLLAILFHTLGEPLEEFAGLTAVEYELYRFLIQSKLLTCKNTIAQSKNRADHQRIVRNELAALFVAGKIPGQRLSHEISIIDEQLHILRMLSEIKRPDILQKRALLQLLKSSSCRSKVGGSEYYKIFRENVLIAQRDLTHARPLDSRLIEFVGRKPQRVFCAKTKRDGDQILYLPASDILYELVASWLRTTRKPRPETPVRWRHEYCVFTVNQPGELLKLFDILFRYSLNIVGVNIGFDGDKRCAYFVCESVPVEGGLFVSCRELDKSVVREMGPTASIVTGSGCPGLTYDRSSKYVLRVRQANVPGMLYRMSSVIANAKMNVESIQKVDASGIEPSGRTTWLVAIHPCNQMSIDHGGLSRLVHQLRNMMGVHACSVVFADEM